MLSPNVSVSLVTPPLTWFLFYALTKLYCLSPLWQLSQSILIGRLMAKTVIFTQVPLAYVVPAE